MPKAASCIDTIGEKSFVPKKKPFVETNGFSLGHCPSSYGKRNKSLDNSFTVGKKSAPPGMTGLHP